jgi:hypothetical protein
MNPFVSLLGRTPLRNPCLACPAIVHCHGEIPSYHGDPQLKLNFRSVLFEDGPPILLLAESAMAQLCDRVYACMMNNFRDDKAL